MMRSVNRQPIEEPRYTMAELVDPHRQTLRSSGDNMPRQSPQHAVLIGEYSRTPADASNGGIYLVLNPDEARLTWCHTKLAMMPLTAGNAMTGSNRTPWYAPPR